MILFAECSQLQSGEVECGWDGGEEGEAPLRRLRQLGPRVQPQRGEQVRPAHVPATQQRVLGGELDKNSYPPIHTCFSQNLEVF